MPSPRRAGTVGDVEPRQAVVSLPPVTAHLACRWCDLARSATAYDLGQLAVGEGGGLSRPGREGEGEAAAYERRAENAAFVALRSPPDGPGPLRGLTLVPRKHVRTLTELPPPEMAEVLAGLSSAAVALEKLLGVDHIEIHADTAGPAGGEGHVRFRVEPVVVLTGAAGGTPTDEEVHGRRRTRRRADAVTVLGKAVPTRRGC